MIDRTKEYWTGDCRNDIDEWLHEYTELGTLEVKPIICHTCGCDVFQYCADPEEGAVQVTCNACKEKKILLDGDEIWEECRPKAVKCICKGKTFNVSVGFDRRANGDVRWVYVGSRCTTCGTLGSYADWNVNYGPTDTMEQNI